MIGVGGVQSGGAAVDKKKSDLPSLTSRLAGMGVLGPLPFLLNTGIGKKAASAGALGLPGMMMTDKGRERVSNAAGSVVGGITSVAEKGFLGPVAMLMTGGGREKLAGAFSRAAQILT